MVPTSSELQYVPNIDGGLVSGTQCTFRPCSEYLCTTSVLPKGVLFGKSVRLPWQVGALAPGKAQLYVRLLGFGLDAWHLMHTACCLWKVGAGAQIPE